jgi:hypothetical protein
MNERVHDSPVESDHPGSVGAPEEEIEVTPAMLRAGYDALFDEPNYPEGGEEGTIKALTFAFRAMWRARLQERHARWLRAPEVS